MKTKLLIFSLLVPTLTFAQSLDRKMEVLVRTDRNRPVVEESLLTDLVSSEAFDGAYFKIVKGKSEEAIRFDADKALTFRAATTYYHLTKARNYFLNKLQSEHVANLPKMTIRIELANKYSPLGHFAHDNHEPQYNNALSIEGGETPDFVKVKKVWGPEIWFRPAKKMHIKDLQVNNSANQEFQVLMKQFRNQIHMQSLQRFLSMAALVAVGGSAQEVFNTEAVMRMVGSSLVMEAGYQLMDPITKTFSRKWYWLDTALIPEIIYHEYSHIAFSDALKLTHSTPIIEGMADFFAGQIANSPKLALNIKKYNTYSGKNAKKKKDYQLQFETTEYANTDFVFGMLWEIKNILGEKQGEAFMFKLRKHLDTNSSIRNELVEGLLQTCDEACETPFVDKLKILKALNMRGI